MIEQNDIKTIKEAVENFFKKATIECTTVDVSVFPAEEKDGRSASEVVDVSVKLAEPQILIGEKGQTLFEMQKLLRTMLNKKLEKVFYLNLDINDYKKKKVEYLKDLAKDLADEVAITKQERFMNPMNAYERRVIHAELANRPDIITESRGEGYDRHVVIKPK